MMKQVALTCALAALACGGGTEEAKPAVAVPAVDAGPQAPAPTLTKTKLGIPREPALVAVGDLSVALKIAPLVDVIGRFVHAEGDVAAAIGLDPSRPAAVVFAAPDASTLAVIDVLRASTTPSIDLCHKVLSLGMPGFMRVMLPTSNAEKLERVVGAALVEQEGWKHVRDGYTKGHMSVAVSDDDAYVAVDLGAQGLDATRGLGGMQGADQPIPPLDGRSLRATWNVKPLAATGYISGMIRACGAISGGSIDPQQKLRILELGLKEAGAIFDLANFEQGDADLTLSPLAFTVRAKPGEHFALPPPEAFAASPSVTLTSAKVVMEESTAFLRAWRLPAGDFDTFQHTVSDAGEYSLLVALPHLVAAMPYLELDDPADPIMRDPNVLKRFDRIEAIVVPADVSVGLLPAGTPLASAQCALEATYPKCPTQAQLKLDAAIKRNARGVDHYVKLVSVKTGETKPRFAVLSSKDQNALASAVTSRAASGLHMEIRTKDLPPQVVAMSPVPVPAMLTGDATVEDGRMVMRLVGK